MLIRIFTLCGGGLSTSLKDHKTNHNPFRVSARETSKIIFILKNRLAMALPVLSGSVH